MRSLSDRQWDVSPWESSGGGGGRRTGIVAVKDHAGLRQLVDVRRVDLACRDARRAVEADVRPAHVVREEHDDVWLRCIGVGAVARRRREPRDQQQRELTQHQGARGNRGGSAAVRVGRAWWAGRCFRLFSRPTWSDVLGAG